MLSGERKLWRQLDRGSRAAAAERAAERAAAGEAAAGPEHEDVAFEELKPGRRLEVCRGAAVGSCCRPPTTHPSRPTRLTE